ncbi:MAG: hypothetical protein RMI89_03675 [Gloeomargarita sp. SKYBB_i_bin120]|nr:hypothetical protein [Gloeomargarita sp. SKYG98]MCS7292059.1 hypothetical protein [Gloeomargarita sp. SKYB120]MDW8177619.1 hypothetical protein [Gloeomargarita sp. SKYBB_i_bin120]
MADYLMDILYNPDEEVIYSGVYRWVRQETPEAVLARFWELFTELRGEPDVVAALERAVLRTDASKRFRYILNRCCYILVNHWRNQSQYRGAMQQLLEMFTRPTPVRGIDRGRAVGTLRRLFQGFAQTDLYLRLYQTITLIDASDEPADDRPLASLLRRYPYLYEAQLTGTEDRQQFREQLEVVQQLQTEAQRQFEHQLARYVTYEYRRALGADKNCQPVKNPTILTNQELYLALKLFGGKVDNGMTYQERAEKFLRENSEGQNYRLFKQNLANYIITSMPAGVDRDIFARKLYKFLDELFPQFDHQGVNDFLLTRTCSRLLNFLVIDNAQNGNHKTFIDLLCQLGPTKVVGLLLKIVLICRKVKGYLERLLCHLFNYYAEKLQGEVRWLIKVLENFKLAFSLHFGVVDLRFIRQLIV